MGLGEFENYGSAILLGIRLENPDHLALGRRYRNAVDPRNDVAKTLLFIDHGACQWLRGCDVVDEDYGASHAATLSNVFQISVWVQKVRSSGLTAQSYDCAGGIHRCVFDIHIARPLMQVFLDTADLGAGSSKVKPKKGC